MSPPIECQHIENLAGKQQGNEGTNQRQTET
jgi:hypothetical protein